MKTDPNVVHNLDDLRRFPLEDDDLVVAGVPKSGTSWIQVMITNLWDDWGVCKTTDRRVPSLHGMELGGGYRGYRDALVQDTPRLIKTHLRREYFPERWPDHGRVVHITRNPKDVIVSLYYELAHQGLFLPDSPNVAKDFDTHFERFLAGDLTFLPFVDNVLSWRLFDHPRLLKITYEDALADTRAAVEAIVEFVGKPTEPSRIDEVIESTQFETMKKNPVLSHQINHPNLREDAEIPFMRKGEVGSWREMMTVAQSERVDREIVRPLEDAGVYLTYVP